MTFAEAWAEAQALATGLAARYGVARGNRVMALRNPRMDPRLYGGDGPRRRGCARDAWWTEGEHGLKDSGAKVVVVDDERLVRLPAARQENLGSSY